MNEGLGVRSNGDMRRAVAIRSAKAGEVITVLQGVVVLKPTRYTIQIGPSEHLDSELPGTTSEARAPWRYLNHACSPNAFLRGRELVAARDLAAGDEVTFDYNTSEYDMDAPFACVCKAPGCKGAIVRGYRYLDDAHRAALRGRAAPHVIVRHQEAQTSARPPEHVRESEFD